MQGYDTLVCAWNEPRDWSLAPWQSETRTTSGVVKHILNRPLVQFTRTITHDPATGVVHRMGTAVQCSLPKLLYGNNIQQLGVDAVPAALDALHKLIEQDFPGAPHPSLMTPRRIDATANRQLPSEREVLAVLEACAVHKMGRTKSYRGDSKSVNWSQNSSGHRSKCYSKLLDAIKHKVDGDLLDQAKGLLRVETGVSGLKGIRADFAKALSASALGGDMSVGTLLACSGLTEAILAPLNAIVDDVLGSEVITLKISEFIQAWLDAGFTAPRAYSALGYAHAVKESGWDNLMLTRQGIHKLKKEFQAAGIDPLELELGPLMARLSKPHVASSSQLRRLERKQANEDAEAVAPASPEQSSASPQAVATLP